MARIRVLWYQAGYKNIVIVVIIFVPVVRGVVFGPFLKCSSLCLCRFDHYLAEEERAGCFAYCSLVLMYVCLYLSVY